MVVLEVFQTKMRTKQLVNPDESLGLLHAAQNKTSTALNPLNTGNFEASYKQSAGTLSSLIKLCVP